MECLNHGLLHPYPVLHEKPGEVVAQIKGTVLLMPNGSSIITSAPRQTVTTEKKVRGRRVGFGAGGQGAEAEVGGKARVIMLCWVEETGQGEVEQNMGWAG